MKRNLLFLVVLSFFSSCFLLNENKTASLYGTWRLYDVEPQVGESGGRSFSEEASLKQVVKDGMVLSFFANGTYTELKGNAGYTTGEFSYAKAKHALLFSSTGKEASPVEARLETGRNGKPLLSLQNKQHSLLLKFLKEAEPGKNDADAPFYPANNQWRIKPAAPETAGQQLQRLTGYLKHVALILKAAKEREQEIISFEFSQGPVKIYNGGIGIHPYEIVPESWKKTFYNDSNAFAAYRRYERYLQTTSYKGGGTGDWVEDDYNILLSIYAGLQEGEKNVSR